MYARNIVRRDGVGNSVFYFKNLFEQKLGVEVLLFALYSDIDYVKSLVELQHLDQDGKYTLFYHYSIEDEGMDDVMRPNYISKIIYYHGITPPESFNEDSLVFKACKKGLCDITLLPSFDLYLSNSNCSSRQYALACNFNTSSKNFYVCPPVQLDYILNSLLTTSSSSFDKDSIRILYIGTLSPHKNIAQIIDVFSSNDFIEGVIVTNSLIPPEYTYLNDAATVFTRVEHKQLMQILGSADCLINLSQHEGFAIPVYEAIAYGIPAIIKRLDCYDDFLPVDYPYYQDGDSNCDVLVLYKVLAGRIDADRSFIMNKIKSTECTLISKLGEFLRP